MRDSDPAPRRSGTRRPRRANPSRGRAGGNPSRAASEPANSDQAQADGKPRRGTHAAERSPERSATRGRHPEPAKRGKASKAGKAGKASKNRKGGTSAERSPKQATTKGRAVDPLSRFSASALRRVSVLGDRPNQVVQSLAEQSQRRRGGYVLGGLLALSSAALLALLGALVLQLVGAGGTQASVETPIVEPPEGHSRLQPDVFHAQEHLELFDPVAEREDDTEPLTEEEVFASEKLSMDGLELTLRDSEVTDVCTALVWGDNLAQSLADGSCASAARGVFQDENEAYVAQFTLFDLADTESATAVAERLDPANVQPGFVLPLDTETAGLNEGYSQATAQVMGHYLAVFWVARADAEAPEDDDSLASLNVVAMDAAVSVYQRVSAAS